MGSLSSNSPHVRESVSIISNRRSPFIVLALLVALLVTLSQSGCVSSSGNLTASQTNLSFGNVAIGSSSTQSLTFRNSGTAPLTITRAAASGRGFNVTGPPLPLTLAGGQSTTFMARFAPSAIGSASGSLLITKTQETTTQLTSGGGSATTSITTEQKEIAMAGTGVPVAPSISTQPASQTVTVGQTATFSVSGSGATPLRYQWNKNGTAITGATSASYATPATTTSDSGSQFTVVVSNPAGNVTSNIATLTVTAAVAPSITTQPTSQTVTAGQPATFSVTGSGSAPLSYQWRKNGTVISGATSAVYATPAATTSDSGSQFMVVVGNAVGSVASNASTLTVTAAEVAPSIITQPTSQTVMAGQTATFAVAGSGSAPLSYQWHKNGVAVSGATSAIYTTPVTATSDSGSQFSVAVGNSSGSVTSNTATLTVNAMPILITVTPNTAKVVVGGIQQFASNVSGTSNIAVTWSLSGVGCTGAACGIISANGLYTSPSSVPSPATVTLNATSVADPTKSTSASITIAAALAVLLSISPTSASVPTSSMQLFTASVTGASNTAVTWGLSGVGCSGTSCGTLATSSLSAVYSAPPVAPSPTTVNVTAASVADPTKSASANLTIVPNVLVSVAPTIASVPLGTTQQFSAAVTGTSNTAVAWIVSGAGCGGAACGTVDSTGRYTAPAAAPTPPTVTVTATSIADPSKSGSVNVTLGATSSANVTVAVQPNGSTTAPFSPLLLLRGGTKRLYANVCTGTNALDCQRPTDITVTWQASCGALNAVTGPYVDYTAPNSGGPCTITATNNASGAAATATATLANPAVSIDVIPAAITLYKNQIELVQAIVIGSINRNVTWSLTTNPGGAGTLNAQGWTATFSTSAAGTYAATVTSLADGTKTAVITFYVTANAMPATATNNHTEPVDCTATGSGTTYEVGPSQTNKTINAVPWNTLAAGDTVRIHNEGANGSPTTYAEKWLIKQSGTASEPIRVCGVPNGGGELPVINAANATTSASYDYGAGANSIEDRAPIVIFNHVGTFGNSPTYPQYVTIEGLKIINEQSTNNFVPQAGGLQAWGAFGGAIWEQHGGHIIIRGMDLENNQQGMFDNNQNPESRASRYLLFEGNYVAGSGISGGFGSHQVYLQSMGQVIQGNYFGECTSGSQGSQIKERGVMTFTRYNYVTATVACLRIFDLVEPQGYACMALVQEFYVANGTCGPTADQVAATEDWYGTDYIYGNIFKFTQPAQPVHYSGDGCRQTTMAAHSIFTTTRSGKAALQK